VEASAIHARAGLGRGRVTLAIPLLRLRSDQQLVGLFRAGNEDAFRVIHDRYRHRLLAYVRQMLAGANPDAEDLLQDVFVRAYAGLRASGRELSLRPWLYRIAHNRCVDELRRPMPSATEPLELAPAAISDPVLESEKRESLRRLIIDIRRLPDQQRSALLMREMSGMSYTDIGGVLGLSVPAVKSLLVRARLGLVAAVEARDTACRHIRSDLAEAHERGVRPSGLARRHMHDCSGCREYRSELRGVSRQLAALAPVLGPLGVLTRLVGAGGGASSGAAAGGTGSGVLAAGGAASAGTTVLGAAATHVAAVVAAAVVTAGGAVEIQRTVATQLDSAPAHHVKPVTSVGQGTSVEGTVAATAAAPISSSLPAPVQQPSAPSDQTRRSRPAAPAKRSAKGGKAVSAQASAPSQAATDTGVPTSTDTSTDPTVAGSTSASCQRALGPDQPVTSTTSPATCTSSNASAATGTPASTSPSSSTGSTSSYSSTSGAGTSGSSSPSSGSSQVNGKMNLQVQNS
jgi:RNA polymerase sigma factor (sigma-70 family)